jgi:ABC-type Fe3+ transport system permease subunit
VGTAALKFFILYYTNRRKKRQQKLLAFAFFFDFVLPGPLLSLSGPAFLRLPRFLKNSPFTSPAICGILQAKCVYYAPKA